MAVSESVALKDFCSTDLSTYWEFKIVSEMKLFVKESEVWLPESSTFLGNPGKSIYINSFTMQEYRSQAIYFQVRIIAFNRNHKFNECNKNAFIDTNQSYK